MYFLNILSLLQNRLIPNFIPISFGRQGVKGGAEPLCPACFIFEENLAVALCQRCLSLSGHTHINREIRIHILCEMPGAEPFPRFLLVFSVLFSLSESVFVCVCLRDQMEVRPVVSVPRQHRRPPFLQLLCVRYRTPCLAFWGRKCARTATCCTAPLSAPDQACVMTV